MIEKAPNKETIMTSSTLYDLVNIIKERRQSTAEKSYTKSLIEAGTGKCCKKLGEEATEMIIAALSEDQASFKEEAADVLYHYLVLLEAKNLELSEIEAVLEQRMGQSGHEEKASRS